MSVSAPDRPSWSPSHLNIRIRNNGTASRQQPSFKVGFEDAAAASRSFDYGRPVAVGDGSLESAAARAASIRAFIV
jgi:hypothetical protein